VWCARRQIVVRVDAVAEVSTTAIRSLSAAEPSTAEPSGLRMSESSWR